MTSISAMNSLSALALTQTKKANDATAFLVSQAFAGTASNVRKDLLSQFYDKGLGHEFTVSYQKWLSQPGPNGQPIPPDMARQSALVDVILAHREDFSSGEFTLSVTLPDGGTFTSPIPSMAAMSADIFKRQVDAKQADYNAQIAAKNEKPDRDAAKLDAMSQAVQTLVLNGDPAAGGGATDAQTAYAILTQKLYPDDKDAPDDSNPNDTDQPTVPPQQS